MSYFLKFSALLLHLVDVSKEKQDVHFILLVLSEPIKLCLLAVRCWSNHLFPGMCSFCHFCAMADLGLSLSS